jgi:hypothetical protein
MSLTAVIYSYSMFFNADGLNDKSGKNDLTWSFACYKKENLYKLG